MNLHQSLRSMLPLIAKLLIFIIFVGVPTSAHQRSKKQEASVLLTRTLVKDIQKQRLVTGMSCLLDIVSFQFSSNQIAWEELSSLQDSFRLQNYVPFHKNNTIFQLINTSTILGKFKSSCWTTILYFQNNLKGALMANYSLPLKKSDLGFRSVYDQYIFIALERDHLNSILSNALYPSTNILNEIARKYGMFIENQNGKTQVGYFIEPVSYTGSFTTSSQVYFQKKLQNFNGRTMTLVFKTWPPFIWRRKDNNRVDGLQQFVLSEISTRENVTFFYHDKLKTTDFGLLLPNGTWTGIIGEMVGGVADFTPTLAPTLQRFKPVTITTPQYLISLVFCLQAPKDKRQWQALIYPLSPLVWFLTLFTYLIFVILFVIKTRLESSTTSFPAPVSLSFQQTTYVTMMRLYTMLLDQPSPLPSAQLSRFVVLVWIFFCYMIGQAYKANLVGYLTFTEKQSIPMTFKELHLRPEYSIILQTVGGLELELFRTSRSPVIQGIAKRMTMEANMLSCILNAASQPNTACIAWNTALANARAKFTAENHQLKDLYVASQESGGSAHGSFVLRKNSIYLETFVRYLGWVRATFLSDMWFQMTLDKIEKEARNKSGRVGGSTKSALPSPLQSLDEDEHPLAKADLFIVFFMVTIGIILSIFSFLVELLVRIYFG